MTDIHGRKIEYLRLSVTERCNMKCVYCHDTTGGEPVGDSVMPCARELSCTEIIEIARAFAALGGRKLRLTGGEPLLRADLEEIISGISAIGAYGDIAMTTNGRGLPDRIMNLKKAGLVRVNISLDSLKTEKYAALTGGGKLCEALSAIDAALEYGMLPVKINMVVIRGENDGEVDNIIALAKDRPLDVRFIELMPIGAYGEVYERRIPNDEIIAARPYLKPLPQNPAQPSLDYTIEGYKGKIGFISAVSHKFCSGCNRVRVTSDGRLKPCLGNNLEIPLLPALRRGEAALENAMREAIFSKSAGHDFQNDYKSTRAMRRIGG